MARKNIARNKSRAQPAPAQPAAAPRDAFTVIRDAELAIVNAVKDKALEGSYLHAKFLFDYAGMTQAQPPSSEPSLPELLLRYLGLPVEPNPEAENQVTSVTSPEI